MIVLTISLEPTASAAAISMFIALSQFASSIASRIVIPPRNENRQFPFLEAFETNLFLIGSGNCWVFDVFDDFLEVFDLSGSQHLIRVSDKAQKRLVSTDSRDRNNFGDIFLARESLIDLTEKLDHFIGVTNAEVETGEISLGGGRSTSEGFDDGNPFKEAVHDVDESDSEGSEQIEEFASEGTASPQNGESSDAITEQHSVHGSFLTIPFGIGGRHATIGEQKGETSPIGATLDLTCIELDIFVIGNVTGIIGSESHDKIVMNAFGVESI